MLIKFKKSKGEKIITLQLANSNLLFLSSSGLKNSRAAILPFSPESKWKYF
jgi:hypothetical protein